MRALGGARRQLRNCLIPHSRARFRRPSKGRSLRIGFGIPQSDFAAFRHHLGCETNCESPVFAVCHAAHMLTSYGPIQQVLVRGSFYELEDKIRAYQAAADDGRGDSDVSSIDADIARMHADLDRMQPLLAR